MEVDKFHTKEYDWTHQENVRGQLTNSVCSSGYGSAGVFWGQKDQT